MAVVVAEGAAQRQAGGNAHCPAEHGGAYRVRPAILVSAAGGQQQGGQAEGGQQAH